MARIKADLIIRNIGELVTIFGYSHRPLRAPTEDKLGIYQNKACVASSQGKICYAGRESDLVEAVNVGSAIEIDAGGKLVIPGFVDSHTHALFSGSREDEIEDKVKGLSYLDILKRGGGILKTVSQTRSSADSELIRETRKRLERMTAFGTTTFEIKSGYGLGLRDELRLLEILKVLGDEKYGFDITPTLLSAHALPGEYSSSEKFLLDVVIPSIDAASKRKIARFCDVFLEEGVFHISFAQKVLNHARARGLRLKVHADEFSDLGGAEFAAKMKVTSADHLLRSSHSGKIALARSNVICVLLPGTSLASFAPAYADARSLIDSGGCVALATDQSPNSWVESMQLVTSLACYAMKMTPAEAIAGVTINGAHALGRAGEIGSIEIGKSSDILICNVSRYQEIPYRIGSNCVETIIKRGKVIKKN